jgi:hypothetical protein
VYRVVPGLYRAEMRSRVDFYSAHPEAKPASQEDAGEVTDRIFFAPEDHISLSIEYFDNYRFENRVSAFWAPYFDSSDISFMHRSSFYPLLAFSHLRNRAILPFNSFF